MKNAADDALEFDYERARLGGRWVAVFGVTRLAQDVTLVFGGGCRALFWPGSLARLPHLLRGDKLREALAPSPTQDAHWLALRMRVKGPDRVGMDFVVDTA
jgi:hypothetical protein